jgi:hypothetical protein
VGHVDHQGAAQAFDFFQVFRHAVEGPGQLAHLVLRATGTRAENSPAAISSVMAVMRVSGPRIGDSSRS